jgi:hypothetical protein
MDLLRRVGAAVLLCIVGVAFSPAAGVGPTGHFEGLTLFLHNPQSLQWSQIFANITTGTLGTPAIGGVQGRQGRFVRPGAIERAKHSDPVLDLAGFR